MITRSYIVPSLNIDSCMMMVLNLLLLSVACAVCFCDKFDSQSNCEFKKSHIIPDIIDKAPDDIAYVYYPDRKLVEMGSELTPTLVKDPPMLVHWEANDTDYYTLCMTDPDVPSRQDPALRELQHWLVVNIPGMDVYRGDTLSEYVGAGSPKGTGLHRYVFLIYRQPGEMKFNEPILTNRSLDHRIHFSARRFAQKYTLGNPVAATFFEAEWDEYVPKLHGQLKGKVNISSSRNL